jgi:pimeloyl-[acyl-carrier protein] methyl ester esterase
MTGLVFLHGWGYGPETWDAWATAFGAAPVAMLDAGYLGQRRMELPENPDGWVGVGHSLGFARLLEMDMPWRGLVGLGGFLRFCQKPGKTTDKMAGTPTDVLNAMLSRLDEEPGDVLTRFHRRCGHKGLSQGLLQVDGPAEGLARLHADLELLRDLDLQPAKPPVPTLLLHAQDDRIVPPDLAREAQAMLPGSRLTLLDSGGHALPMTRTQDCLRLVREFLHDLA